MVLICSKGDHGIRNQEEKLDTRILRTGMRILCISSIEVFKEQNRQAYGLGIFNLALGQSWSR